MYALGNEPAAEIRRGKGDGEEKARGGGGGKLVLEAPRDKLFQELHVDTRNVAMRLDKVRVITCGALACKYVLLRGTGNIRRDPPRLAEAVNALL